MRLWAPGTVGRAWGVCVALDDRPGPGNSISGSVVRRLRHHTMYLLSDLVFCFPAKLPTTAPGCTLLRSLDIVPQEEIEKVRKRQAEREEEKARREEELVGLWRGVRWRTTVPHVGKPPSVGPCVGTTVPHVGKPPSVGPCVGTTVPHVGKPPSVGPCVGTTVPHVGKPPSLTGRTGQGTRGRRASGVVWAGRVLSLRSTPNARLVAAPWRWLKDVELRGDHETAAGCCPLHFYLVVDPYLDQPKTYSPVVLGPVCHPDTWLTVILDARSPCLPPSSSLSNCWLNRLYFRPPAFPLQSLIQRLRAAQEAMESEAKEEEFYLKALVNKATKRFEEVGGRGPRGVRRGA